MENGDKNNEYYDKNYDDNMIMANTKTIDVKVYQNTFTDINAFYYLKKNNMLFNYIYINVKGSMLECLSANILEATTKRFSLIKPSGPLVSISSTSLPYLYGTGLGLLATNVVL